MFDLIWPLHYISVQRAYWNTTRLNVADSKLLVLILVCAFRL